jgi:hypothetical protein
VALVRTDASEEPSASIIRVTRIFDLLTTLVVTEIDLRCEEILCENHMMEALRSSETSVLTRATQRNFPEDSVIHTGNCIVLYFQGGDFGKCRLVGCDAS